MTFFYKRIFLHEPAAGHPVAPASFNLDAVKAQVEEAINHARRLTRKPPLMKLAGLLRDRTGQDDERA
jgi:hypothetical protein